MLRTLIEKECKSILLSPRFVGTFAVVSALILLSVVVGIQSHRAFERAQAAPNAAVAFAVLRGTKVDGDDTLQRLLRSRGPTLFGVALRGGRTPAARRRSP